MAKKKKKKDGLMPPKNSVRNKAESAQTSVLGTKPSNGGALMRGFFEDDK